MNDFCLMLFGSPRIEYQETVIKVERRKALGLAAYLAMSERPQSRDTLAALLWPDLDQEHARAALRSTLPTLTALSSQLWLTATRTTVALRRDAVRVDVRDFLDLLAQSRSHGHGLEAVCAACVPLFEQCIALYQDDFLADFTLQDNAEFEQWQVTQREWLSREFSGVLRRLAHYYAAHGVYDRAVHYARQWVALDPLHEPAQRMLIRLYAANGQRTDALRQYQICIEMLETELATIPDDETTRLYEIIRKNSFAPTDVKLPVSSSVEGDSTTASVLPPLPAVIVGREAAMDDIKGRLGIGEDKGSPTEPHPVTVIQGWPGVGKSTLIAALAHDLDITRTFADGVLWASLGERPSLSGELMAWAGALNLVEPGKTPDQDEITTQLIAVLRDKRMVLILDDVWQVEHAAPFKVGGRHCAFIVTSRLNDVAEALAPVPGDVYRLSVLSENKALELLNMLAPDAVADHPDEARELVHDLEGLPLAIQVAGRLLHSEARLGWGVSDLLRELRQGANLLSAHVPGDMVSAAYSTPAATPTVAALLRRSTDLLDAETRQRFALLGLFIPKPATFDLHALSALWDVTDPKQTVRILVNRGLLEPISGGRFQMHALLVLHAQSLLEA